MAEASEESGVYGLRVSSDTLSECVIEGEMLLSSSLPEDGDIFGWEPSSTLTASQSSCLRRSRKATSDDAALVKQRKEDIRRAFKMMKKAEQV